jgi:hypothetical protein
MAEIYMLVTSIDPLAAYKVSDDLIVELVNVTATVEDDSEGCFSGHVVGSDYRTSQIGQTPTARRVYALQNPFRCHCCSSSWNPVPPRENGKRLSRRSNQHPLHLHSRELGIRACSLVFSIPNVQLSTNGGVTP